MPLRMMFWQKRKTRRTGIDVMTYAAITTKGWEANICENWNVQTEIVHMFLSWQTIRAHSQPA